MRLNFLIFSLALQGLSFSPVLAADFSDDVIEFSTGFYSLTAKSPGKNGSLSGPGIYHFMYHHRLMQKYSISFGYTAFMSDVVSGDMGFGPDISGYYYPFSNNGTQKSSDGGTTIVVQEIVRPFIGLGFHQRQFQSVSASYAGYGVYSGVDYQWSEGLTVRGEARFLQMTGSSTSTATQMDLLLGILINF